MCNIKIKLRPVRVTTIYPGRRRLSKHFENRISIKVETDEPGNKK